MSCKDWHPHLNEGRSGNRRRNDIVCSSRNAHSQYDRGNHRKEHGRQKHASRDVNQNRCQLQADAGLGNYAYDDTCGWLEGNPVYEEKLKLLRDNGIVVFRDHDHMHAHRPDGIFTYVMKQLGWTEYLVPDAKGWMVRLPETTLGELTMHVKKAMHLDHIRYIGNPDAKVSTVGFCGHLLPGPHTNWSNNDQVAASWAYDVVIPGETVDWTAPLYYYDAAVLGHNKGMIIPGHFVQEEAGMRLAHEWLQPVVGEEMKITFVAAGDLVSYL